MLGLQLLLAIVSSAADDAHSVDATTRSYSGYYNISKKINKILQLTLTIIFDRMTL